MNWQEVSATDIMMPLELPTLRMAGYENLMISHRARDPMRTSI